LNFELDATGSLCEKEFDEPKYKEENDRELTQVLLPEGFAALGHPFSHIDLNQFNDTTLPITWC